MDNQLLSPGTARRSDQSWGTATIEASLAPKLALLVDAAPGLSAFLHPALQAAGIHNLTRTTLTGAEEQLRKAKFDLILVGLSEAPSHGVELTRRIRASGANRATPVILIATQETKGALARAFDAGANFFISLPMNTERLTRLIASVASVEQKVRRFRRVAQRIKVQLASPQLRIEGETIDISLGGMLVRVPQAFPAGAALEISLQLPSIAKPVVGLGSVARTSGENQLGVRIDRLAIEESRRLEEFLLPLLAA